MGNAGNQVLQKGRGMSGIKKVILLIVLYRFGSNIFFRVSTGLLFSNSIYITHDAT